MLMLRGVASVLSAAVFADTLMPVDVCIVAAEQLRKVHNPLSFNKSGQARRQAGQPKSCHIHMLCAAYIHLHKHPSWAPSLARPEQSPLNALL